MVVGQDWQADFINWGWSSFQQVH